MLSPSFATVLLLYFPATLLLPCFPCLPPSPPHPNPSTDVELAKFAEGVNALSVDPSGSSPAGSPGGGEQQDTDTQADSPDYNDINFWKPSMNWFE